VLPPIPPNIASLKIYHNHGGEKIPISQERCDEAEIKEIDEYWSPRLDEDLLADLLEITRCLKGVDELFLKS